MSGMRTRLDRATEYRRLALAATALVESSLLANVRDKHELAAARWTDLAELAERSTAPRLAQDASLPMPAAPRDIASDGEAPVPA